MDKETSEIAKLTERIAKDPKSKLFVPLAEEYKKDGDIEMAIFVLMEGLKNNPGYVTARSFLGKLLIEQGDLSGAQKEFEEVVKAIPDNLMAQSKLGDLYALQNRPGEALSPLQDRIVAQSQGRRNRDADRRNRKQAVTSSSIFRRRSRRLRPPERQAGTAAKRSAAVRPNPIVSPPVLPQRKRS